MRGKTHPPYSAEYRRRIVDLYRNGRTPEQLAREFEPSAPTIREWCQQADRDAGGGDGGATSAEREELARLRRENRRLREEREIPRKATAWFARDNDPVDGSSGSSRAGTTHGGVMARSASARRSTTNGGGPRRRANPLPSMRVSTRAG